jgi:hypothetical protein
MNKQETREMIKFWNEWNKVLSDIHRAHNGWIMQETGVAKQRRNDIRKAHKMMKTQSNPEVLSEMNEDLENACYDM